MPATTDHAKITATPLRIGRFIAAEKWGEEAEFRIDPWLLKAERLIVDCIMDRTHKRLAKMNAPPQVSKTTLLEFLTPFWTLGLFPNTRIICVAYSDDLAQVSGGDVRDAIRRWGPQLFGIDIDPDYDSRKEWRVAGHSGGMLSVGIGSTITGKPCELMLIGDLIKNMKEAASPTIKKLHREEWEGSLRPRLGPGSTCLLAATRFADDDLSGSIDAKMAEPGYEGERWESLVIPAIAEPSEDDPNADDPEWRDQLGRVRGEPLQCRHSLPGDEKPENWHGSHFYVSKRSTDPVLFSCLFQQNPVTREGSMFPDDKWEWYDMTAELPSIVDQRRVWDLAATEGGGDFTVGQKVAKMPDNEFWVLDVQRFQKGSVATKTLVEVNAALDGVSCPILIEEEKSGAGKTVVAFYKKDLPYNTLRPAYPDGGKTDRARPASILQQTGKIRLPRNPETGESPPWVKPYVQELRRMTEDGRTGRHDDQIDTLAYAVNDMLDSTALEIEQGDLWSTLSGMIAGSPADVM